MQCSLLLCYATAEIVGSAEKCAVWAVPRCGVPLQGQGSASAVHCSAVQCYAVLCCCKDSGPYLACWSHCTAALNNLAYIKYHQRSCTALPVISGRKECPHGSDFSTPWAPSLAGTLPPLCRGVGSNVHQVSLNAVQYLTHKGTDVLAQNFDQTAE